MANWKEKIDVALDKNGESWDDIECLEISFNINKIYSEYELETFYNKYTIQEIESMSLEEKLLLEFCDEYKTCPCPIQFQAWTRDNIYFSEEYDSSDFVMSKKRNLPNCFRPHNKNNIYYKPIKLDYEKGNEDGKN